MEKFSVKKPFTILVMVVMIIVLGFVSVTRLTTDLLPSLSLPYLMVITTYPGASPEKVESSVSEPLESALGTISGVKNIYSISNENYSLIELEFEDGTDMDSALVKVSSAVDESTGSLPDECGSPSIMEISMDMMATLYVAVGHDDYDTYELTDYIENEVIPTLERQDGVASVTNVGTVDKTIQVDLNQTKINNVNDKILAQTNIALSDAKAQLDDAQAQVTAGQDALNAQQSVFGETMSSAIFGSISSGVTSVTSQVKPYLATLSDQVGQLGNELTRLSSSAISGVNTAGQYIGTAADGMSQGLDQINNAASQIAAGTEGLVTAGDEDTGADESSTSDTDSSASADDTSSAGSSGTIDPALIAEMQTQLAQIQETLGTLSDAGVTSYADLMALATQTTAQTARLSQMLTSINAADVNNVLSTETANVQNTISSASSALDQIPSLLSQLESAYGTLTQAQLDAAVGFSTAAIQLSDAQTQLEAAMTQYEAARDSALENANLDSLVTTSTLSQLIYAQNFSMPAGYIDDENDNSWLLKVGEAYESSEALADALLVDLDDIGTIRLSDIADITVIDNADSHYAKLNGKDAVVLCIYKSSTAGTNEVSTTVNDTLAQIQEENPGTQVVSLMDQGDYITIIVNSILTSMALGAALAILILALFLGDVRPTIMVGISIPLSVLLTVVLMYFSGLSLNMMTLSGISLGIGMLVDNSIVVMENIFRLRGTGLSAPRAAVQGAKQVRGAIIASTLTTVCVFLPMVFTTGTVRSLLIPMALSIGYCLMASLLISLTVVPASASTLMRNVKPKQHKFFDKVANAYGRSLRWCLRFKIVPLAVTIALLVLTTWRLITIGIVLFPDMTSTDIQVTITTPETDERAVSYQKVDDVMNTILNVDGVIDVGIMDEASTTGMVASVATQSDSYGSYTCYVTADDNAGEDEVNQIIDAINNGTKDMDCEVEATSGGMSDMSSLMGSDELTINIYGKELDELESIADDVISITNNVEGFSDAKSSTEEGESSLLLNINKDKAMSYGLTVAQIYADIAARLNTSVDAATITVDGVDMTITLQDETDPLTKENILDMEFEATDMTQASADTSMSDMAAAFSTSSDSDETEEEEESNIHKLGEFASIEETTSMTSINRKNQIDYITVTASTADGYNTTLLSRTLSKELDKYSEGLGQGYRVEIAGQVDTVNDMVTQMLKLLALGLLFIYLVMVAQFQSLLSPFIVLFTVPLAFTGGMIGLMIAGQPLSMLSCMGFLILMGTVVNNGIVFVDYANQLRQGGMQRRDALVATGRTRMRPILMTALTTILAMTQLIFGNDLGSQLGSGMAIVIAGGLLYATLMTLYIIPIMYDIFFKRQPLSVDVGDDIDDVPDDAAQFLQEMRAKNEL